MLYHLESVQLIRIMRAIRNSLSARRWPQSAALLLLCTLLFAGQIAETAHAEADCEHESCSLCVGSGADDSLAGDFESLTGLCCALRSDAAEPTHSHPSFQFLARCIRGPPSP